MKKILLVSDMQNDFIDGALGTPEAVAIVDNVKAKVNCPPPTHNAKRWGLRAAYAVTGQTPARCPA